MSNLPTFFAGGVVGLVGSLIPQIILLWQGHLTRKHALIDARNERVRRAGTTFLDAVGAAMTVLDEVEMLYEMPIHQLLEYKDSARLAKQLRDSVKTINESAAMLALEFPILTSLGTIPSKLLATLIEVERIFGRQGNIDQAKELEEYKEMVNWRKEARERLSTIYKLFSEAISKELN